MTQHYFTENVPGGLVTIVRAAIGTQAEGITDVDIGKAVKMSDAQNYVLTADGDNIEGVINSIEAWTVNEGYAFGGVQTGCRFVATVVTGATVAVLDAVISADQEAAGANVGAFDNPALVKPSATPTVYDTGWRCIRIVSGDGTAGSKVLLEAI